MKKRIISGIIILLLLIGAVFGIQYFNSYKGYQQAISEITFANIDASEIPDGIYVGEEDVNFISARVEVEVRQGTITRITLLEHNHDRGSTAEVITDKIIEQQIVDVDTVSGATNSSMVIKKAVDNALSSALSK